jgi:hypothetical protein
MRQRDDYYWMPILPREIAHRIKDLKKEDWPKGVKADYDRLHREFSAAKSEYRSWIRKDRDSRMSNTAKQIASYILDCLNFDTGRCDPGYEAIAAELNIGVRTVERWVPKIAASGWMEIVRRGRTTTNFYRWRVPVAKVNMLLDAVEVLRTERQERREAKKLPPRLQSDPPLLADHTAMDPSFVADHEPSEVAGHEPPFVADKYMKGTREDEPVNKGSCSRGKGESLYGDNDQQEEVATSGDSRNLYASAKRGTDFDENLPYPIPANQRQAELVIENLCFNRSVPEVLKGRMLVMLQRGILTPGMAGRLTMAAKESAA